MSEADEGSGSSDTDGLEARWLDDADGDDVTAAGYQPRRPRGGSGPSGRKRQRESARGGAEAAEEGGVGEGDPEAGRLSREEHRRRRKQMHAGSGGVRDRRRRLTVRSGV